MKSAGLIVRRERCQDDRSGRYIVRFTPIFNPDVCASGSLSFAFFEAWENEPAEVTRVELAAVENARAVMARFSAGLACSKWEVQSE